MNIYFKNFGCKLNLAELQEYQLISHELGFKIADKPERADMVLVNSCHVTQKAFEKILHFLHKKVSTNSKVIITGCFPRTTAFPKNYYLLSEDKKRSLRQLLLNLSGVGDKTNFSKIKLAKTRAFIEIQQGCATCCSYCIIPYYRGKPVSKSLIDIVSNINLYLDLGVKEIVLTGTNLGKYDHDNLTLSGLLKEILNKTKVNRLRVSSIDVTDIDNELLKVYAMNQDRLCPHFHLALQSGSSRILKLMRRPYNSKKYLATVKRIYENLPNANITADVIVGFPQEDSLDFLQSCKIVENAEFLKCHIFSYSEHLQTLSAQIYPKVDSLTIRQRQKELSKISRQISTKRLSKFLHSCWPVLYEGRQSDCISGYTTNYLPVKTFNYNKDKNYRNQILPTKLVSIKNNYIIGEIVTT